MRINFSSLDQFDNSSRTFHSLNVSLCLQNTDSIFGYINREIISCGIFLFKNQIAESCTVGRVAAEAAEVLWGGGTAVISKSDTHTGMKLINRQPLSIPSHNYIQLNVA